MCGVITQRPGVGTSDLLAAESVCTHAWLDDAPFAESHLADLEWWYANAAPDELGACLRLWEVDGELAAWSWLRNGQLHWEVWRGHGAAGTGRGDVAVLEAILRAAIDETPGALGAWSPEDDAATLELLDRFGFQPLERRQSQFLLRLDGGWQEPEVFVPDGYHIRSLTGPREIEARMAVHRAAFAPSLINIEKYTRLTTLPHYSFDDDIVMEAADGSIAAFAMAWWDPVARFGEFEPVGTHPDHQRRGLARALLNHGMRRLGRRGARLIQIYSMAQNGASEALYEAVGFERRRYRRLFERPREVLTPAVDTRGAVRALGLDK